MDEDELIAALDGVELVGIRSKTQLTAKVFESCPSLIAAGTFSIGTNQIDLASAARLGIPVFNAPFSNTRSVVELAVAEIIGLMRRLPEHNRSLQAGVWSKSSDGSHEVRGRTLGIIGYGNIGSQLSVIAEALGMKVVFFDIAEKLSLGNASKAVTIADVLRVSDIVTLHVDGRPGNAGFFGAERVRPDEEGLDLPQPLARLRRRHRRASRRHASRGTSPAPPSTCSPTNPRRRATRSRRPSRAWRTSS